MRQIKASEVKPGMTIRWEEDGAKIQIPVYDVDAGAEMVGLVPPTKTPWRVKASTLVTVLDEPQPEEPTEFGARVRVRDGRFVRLDAYAAGVVPWSEEGTGAWWSWKDLCEMGPVTVIPDQGWTVPADTPEVPERIEEWPDEDDHLREHLWRNRTDHIWRYGFTGLDTGWFCGGILARTKPIDGPWTRVSDT